MKVSLNWVKEFTEVDLPIDELVEKIGAQLGAVEEVTDLAPKYQGIIVAKVVSCVKHPDADKLSLCKIDAGGKAKDVKRDENGYVQVVCGAPNVREGLLVAWLPPGATVPSTFNKEPFVLESRELRGQISNGMLASPKELDLGDSHDGILVVDYECQPGADFAEVYKLDDYIIDIENKMFTHRPDCFGMLGIAREIAGILGKPFTSPEWYRQVSKNLTPRGPDLPLTVRNELPEAVPRFMAVAFSGIEIKPSTVWYQTFLSRVGVRPINNIVDITNYMMLLSGQPLHAYDYDKVKALSGSDGAAIIVRNPRSGEKIKLLGGKEIEPRPEAVMIATDKQLIGVGGVMGGMDTEVDANTKNIILECANFDMFSIRRTSMAHGLFTDAVTRFNKGQSPLQNDRAVTQAAQMITTGHAEFASDIIDDNHLSESVLSLSSLYPAVKVSTAYINERLGLTLPAVDMKKLLENVEFKVAVDGDNLTVGAPFWRTDIEQREDVIEEIGRLYGYDKLPLVLPERDLSPAPRNELLDLKAAIRERLSKAGANEVLTYSFVPGSLLEKTGQDKAKAFEIANALSPDLQYYRMSLIPSLLEKIHPNIKAGYDEFALFELGKAHVVGEPDAHEASIPKEVNALGFLYAAKNARSGAPYYEAQNYLMNLLANFQLWRSVRLEPLQGADLYQNPWLEQMTAPFEPQRSAILRDDTGLVWGVVGEFKVSVRRAFKLPPSSAGFEVDPLLLMGGHEARPYTVLPRFPKISQDITLKVSSDLSYQEILQFVWAEIEKNRSENSFFGIRAIDIYQPEGSDSKHLTFRLKVASYERTLTDAEVNELLDKVAEAAKTKFDAERI